MMKFEVSKVFFSSLIVTVLLLASNVQASLGNLGPNEVYGPWVTEVENEDFTVYARVVEGRPIREVKIEAELQTSMEALLTIIGDIETFPDWIPMLAEVKWIAQPDKTGLSFVYMVTDVPWPVTDRDVAVRTQISHDADKKEVYFSSLSEPKKIPEAEGMIRIPASTASWVLTDKGNGTIKAVLQSHADPGGKIPKWIADFVVVKGPKDMFVNLIKALEDPKWSKADYPYDMDYVFGYPSPLPFK